MIDLITFAVGQRFKFVVVEFCKDEFANQRPDNFANLKCLFEKLGEGQTGKILQLHNQFEKRVLKVKQVSIYQTKIKQIFEDISISKLTESITPNDILNAMIYLISSDVRINGLFVLVSKNKKKYMVSMNPTELLLLNIKLINDNKQIMEDTNMDDKEKAPLAQQTNIYYV